MGGDGDKTQKSLHSYKGDSTIRAIICPLFYAKNKFEVNYKNPLCTYKCMFKI